MMLFSERSFRYVTKNCEYMREGMIDISSSLPRGIDDYMVALRDTFNCHFHQPNRLRPIYMMCLQMIRSSLDNFSGTLF